MHFLTSAPGGAPRPAVICLGLSAMDYIWRVAAMPLSGTKVPAPEFIEMGGGLAATASVAAARLGARSAFWGRAGDDPAGRATRDELARYGVDVTNYRLFEGKRTSVSGVFVDASGERTVANFRGAGLPLEPDWMPLGEVSKADSVLGDVRWPQGAAALFAAAREHGVPTVFDGDFADEATFDMVLPHTDYAVFSEVGLATIGAKGDAVTLLRRALSKGCRTAAVTRGPRGSLWLHEGKIREFSAFTVDVVDTTGAGDVFHGAFAFAIGAGADLAEAVTFSSAAAALKCAKAGGRPGIPDLATTAAFLDRVGSLPEREPVSQ